MLGNTLTNNDLFLLSAVCGSLVVWYLYTRWISTKNNLNTGLQDPDPLYDFNIVRSCTQFNLDVYQLNDYAGDSYN